MKIVAVILFSLLSGAQVFAQSNPSRTYVWTADCRPNPAHPQVSLVVIKTNLADSLNGQLPARGLAVITGATWMKYAMLIDVKDNAFRVYNGRGTLLTMDTLQKGTPKGDRVEMDAVGGELLNGIALKCELNQ